LNAQPLFARGAVAARLRRALLLVEQLHRELVQAADRALVAEDLSLAQWVVVSELASGPAPLTRVARRLARDPGALSRATTQLIQRGLLRSARHEKDRRRATLSLTPHGRALHERVAAAFDATVGAPGTSVVLDRLFSLFPCDDMPATPSAPAARAAASPRRHDLHALSQENDP
jgi:DNA-binding MarR family transcriptional regulator